MRLFLFRHGQSQGNENLATYRERGDPHIELTNKGWRQAIRAGAYLKEYTRAHPAPGAAIRPFRLWSSTFMRARQTAAGIIHGADSLISPDEFHVSPLLVEQNFGLYAYVSDEKERIARLELPFVFYDAAYKQDKYTARPPMGESPQDVQIRAYPFIGMLSRDNQKGITEAGIVTHGVTLRALCMAFMKIDPARYRDFPNPENCSIYKIEGGCGKWSLTQIYNGETGQAVDIDWGARLQDHKSCLPAVPDQIRRRFSPRK